MVQTVDDHYPKVQLATAIHMGVHVQVRNLRGAAVAALQGDGKQLDELLHQVEVGSAATADALDKLGAMPKSPEGEALYKAMVAAQADYVGSRDEAVRQLRTGQPQAAAKFVMYQLRKTQHVFEAAIDKVAGHEQSTMASMGERAKAGIDKTALVTVSIAAGVLVIAVFCAWAITRSITLPIGEAVKVANAVASGDLCVAIEVNSKDEAGQLLAALKEMIASVRRIVDSVRTGSENVATASAQIAQGNSDLSGRTEEQASALEQTAATMEELSSTVRNNADNARQADQLAQDAAKVATEGGEAVGQVVGTMKGISESSRKIGDIIGVIDGIAFQTNILALNAAVEAARAGEQGRGFAVVAGEVRTLAQRSAGAAKEIRSLIGRNVEQVEQGTAQVDKAGETMAEIVGSIRRVSGIVSEITAATVEQSNGIQQVGDAVGQMDRATQQNAALVEESAAAAESLTGQAQKLVQAVAFFKLGGSGMH